jgi:hypothetical protein
MYVIFLVICTGQKMFPSLLLLFFKKKRKKKLQRVLNSYDRREAQVIFYPRVTDRVTESLAPNQSIFRQLNYFNGIY